MIINGDSLHYLQELVAGSIDFVCTDPPYGYSFMGKDWDKAVPSVDIWKECLRVLKPGAFMCVMSAPRADVQNAMISRLMEAGFRLDFTPIYWTYASGFPKAGNIGKLVDKRNGVKGEVIGQGKAGAGMNKVKGFGQNTTKGGEATTEWDVRAVVSDLDGSYAGFQPKPAVEVIIVAMKPLSEKTYVDQALANGKGIRWLDDCRVPTGENLNGGAYSEGDSEWKWEGGKHQRKPGKFQQPQGRFPANLLVSDDVLNDGTITKGAKSNSSKKKYIGYDGGWDDLPKQPGPNDSGSYSRYFDLDKWASTLPFLICPKASKSEKNKGLEGLGETSAPKNGKEKRLTVGGSKDTALSRANHHPTVKPLKLMSYLITLFSREGETVLDPFVGSGTTVVAAKQLNRKGIGIEREAEYAEIAQARLDHLTIKLPEEPVTQPPVTMDDVIHSRITQLSMF